MTPQEQAHVFAAMLCCGACMGTVYDLLSPVRHTKGLCGVGDLLFGVLCAAGIIVTALTMQTEAFRLYVFAGAGLGFGAYMLTVGLMLRRLAHGIGHLRRKSGEK